MSSNELMAPIPSATELMGSVSAPVLHQGDAGLGSELLDAGDTLLPRAILLQAQSPQVMEGMPGAKVGVWWLQPHNRPVTLKSEEPARFVVARIFPAQRMWNPRDQGGGIICDASGGDLTAREALGLKGASLDLMFDDKGTVSAIEWTGGKPTDKCIECVYGPAAAAAASGKPATGNGNAWLPKIIETKGRRVRLPDNLRSPKCTRSLDTLVLLAVPAFEGFQPEIVPAFISFSRTSEPTGRQLAGMIRLAVREPAWSKIYTLSSRKMQNDKGTWFAAAVSQFGFARPDLAEMARDLYEASKTQTYRPDMSGSDETIEASVSSAETPPKDDEPAPDDAF